MSKESPSVLLVSDQPVLRRGFEHVLGTRGFSVESSEMCSFDKPQSAAAGESSPVPTPDMALLDITGSLSFGDLTELHGRLPGCPLVLWAESMPLDMVFRALEFGVRGIVDRSSSADHLAESLMRVAGGEMQIGFAAAQESGPAKRRSGLTPREREIVGLLRQGLRNKQIAQAMNITEGTVKIYLFRLFHKLGVRNRFELAQCGAGDEMMMPAPRKSTAPAPHPVIPAPARVPQPQVARV